MGLAAIHRPRIAVAMSGGIDSAVSALLLRNQGYRIEGVFMHNWDSRIESGQHCTVESDLHFATKAASVLQIPLRQVNFVRQYWQNVFEHVLGEYSAGSTPNPDILCNREIKFGSLLQWIHVNGFSHLATGHYARNIMYNGRRYVGQAQCLAKDQSYFLADVSSLALHSVLFPLGTLASKHQVRQIAAESGLEFLLDKPESMGMCFIGKRRNFQTFLSEFVNVKDEQVIIDIDTNRVLGELSAGETCTLGQNVRIAGLPAKMFVVKKCNASQRLYVSKNKYAISSIDS